MQKLKKFIGGILTAAFGFAIFIAPTAAVSSNELTNDFLEKLSPQQAVTLRENISKKMNESEKIFEECIDACNQNSEMVCDCEDEKKQLQKIGEDYQKVNIFVQRHVNVNLTGESNEKNATIGADLQLDEQKQHSGITSLLTKIVNTLVILVGSVAFIFIVIAGIRMLVSAGNDNEMEEAKKMLTMAITGLVVALLAYVIVAMVRGLLY